MECLAFLVVLGVVVSAVIVVVLGKARCPYCRRRVERDSGACPRCGRDLEPEFWKRPI
jgi:predicted amidophosphoribosyltransferase